MEEELRDEVSSGGVIHLDNCGRLEKSLKIGDEEHISCSCSPFRCGRSCCNLSPILIGASSVSQMPDQLHLLPVNTFHRDEYLPPL